MRSRMSIGGQREALASSSRIVNRDRASSGVVGVPACGLEDHRARIRGIDQMPTVVLMHNVEIGLKGNAATQRNGDWLADRFDELLAGKAALTHTGLALAFCWNSNGAH